MTCRELIIEKLKWSSMPLAVHEFNLELYSQNNIATRCNELERAGLLKSRFRAGKNFKEWSLQRYENQQALLF